MRHIVLAFSVAMLPAAALAEGAVTDHAELWDKQRAKSKAERSQAASASKEKKTAGEGAQAEDKAATPAN